jgi:hypothetical protein
MPSDQNYAYPPTHHLHSAFLPTPSASTALAEFLSDSLERPYLHPDATLSLDGIRYGPRSGPQGSWAFHHLRRIEAGMRGESLAVETTEELVAKFGEDVVKEATGMRPSWQGAEAVEEEQEEVAVEEDTVREWAPPKTKQTKPAREMTKAEKKKARRAEEKAANARAKEAGEDVPNYRKRKLGEGDSDDAAIFDINDPSHQQTKEEFDLEQKPLVGDIAGRDPAGVDREDAVAAPVVVKHDPDGEVEVPEKSKKRKASVEEQEARRLAKKLKKEEKVKNEEQDRDGDVEMADVPPQENGVEKKKSKKERKAEKAKGDGAKERKQEKKNNKENNQKQRDQKDQDNSKAMKQANGTPADQVAKPKKKKKARSEV